MNQRAVKKKVLALLQSEDLEHTIKTLRTFTHRYVLKSLFSGICSSNETIRWHAISSMGPIVAELADQDLEAARIVMRRFMWSLNDESGGIGWGAPEAMAEIMVCHETLAEEYAHILVGFMREDGFFLEYEPLQRGLMWALGRLAQVRATLLHSKNVVHYLLPYLASPDATVQGLAAWALGNLNASEAIPQIKQLINNNQEIRFYLEGKLSTTTTGQLAQQALTVITQE